MSQAENTPSLKRSALSAGSEPEAPVLIHSGCKVNLYLEITGLLPNGYHGIRTLMLSLRSPFDRMRVSCVEGSDLTVLAADFIDPRNNTLKKSYDLYAQKLQGMRVKAGQAGLPGLRVELEKGVPHGAGLGGGSADAAALLLFLERCRQERGFTPLGRAALLEIAAAVGADVPFFIIGETAWAEGIGEKLTPAPTPFEGMHLVLVCPPIPVSTPWAYAAWDEMQTSSTRALTSSAAQDTYLLSAQFGLGDLFNSFEEVVFPKHPELASIKRKLLDLGAGGALMSGSGSSVFGIFSDVEKAEEASAAMQKSGLKAFGQAINAGASPSW